MERKHGQRSSALLFLFWLLVLAGLALPLSTAVHHQTYKTDVVEFAALAAKLLAAAGLVALYSLAEPSLVPAPAGERAPCPDLTEPLWSRLVYHWMLPVMKRGEAGDMTELDIPHMLPKDHSHEVDRVFMGPWTHEVDKARKR